jgi:hypothetical protein
MISLDYSTLFNKISMEAKLLAYALLTCWLKADIQVQIVHNVRHFSQPTIVYVEINTVWQLICLRFMA